MTEIPWDKARSDNHLTVPLALKLFLPPHITHVVFVITVAVCKIGQQITVI
jgi:hypothetical protein